MILVSSLELSMLNSILKSSVLTSKIYFFEVAMYTTPRNFHFEMNCRYYVLFYGLSF